jgi:hypothetical protein
MVNACDGGWAQIFILGESACADAILVLLVDTLPEGFGTVATWEDAGELGDEGSAAAEAEEAVGVDDEPGGEPEAV